MNHKKCDPVREETVHEKHGDGYFKIMLYLYCEHGEVVSGGFVDHYVENNIAGAYREHWGKHG